MILRTRTRIPARVVVHEKERRGGGTNGLAKYLPGMHETRRQRPDGYLILPDQPVSSVQEKNVKRLAFRMDESGLEVALDVVGATNRPSSLERLLSDSLGKFEGRSQTRGLGRTQSHDRSESGRRSRCEIDQPAKPLENGPSERTGIIRSAAGSKYQGQQLGIRKSSCTVASEALAGAITPRCRIPDSRIRHGRLIVEPGYAHAAPPRR